MIPFSRVLETLICLYPNLEPSCGIIDTQTRVLNWTETKVKEKECQQHSYCTLLYT